MTETTIPINSHAIVLAEVVEMGGAERSCLALARWLYEHGMPSHFVTYQDKVGLDRFADHPLPVVQLRPKMEPLRKIQAVRSYFTERIASPRPLMSGYQPALHASLAGLRGFHCLMHDTPSLFSGTAKRQTMKKRTLRWVSDKAASRGLRSGGQTIVTSEYLKSETHRVFGIEPAIARMGGLKQADFRLRPVSGSLAMLSVSRVEANKRIDWMIRSLAALEHAAEPLSKKVDWHLDVTGKGSALEAMRLLAAECRVADRIHFHGFVSDRELVQLYDAADLFLMPAVQGYGIPAIESLSRGIPVLLHRESGVSDILLKTPWATVIEGGEESMTPGLVQAIDKVVQGKHLKVPLPDLPTEDSWAEQVARLCNWV